MLKHIRLIDFKGFVDEQVEFARLTLLVGANASGKSNIFDAIRFLSKLPENDPVLDILDGTGRARDKQWPGIRGRAGEAARVGCQSFELRTTWLADDISVSHAVRCRTAPDVHITHEEIDPSPAWGEALRAVARTFGLSVLNLMGSEWESSPRAKRLRTALASTELLDPRPERMRDFGRKGQPLGPHGDNLSGVLADLCADPAERRGFVDWLAELCAPELTDLDFITVPELGDVMAVAVERGGKRISARSLSDGTLRFLCLLLALRTAEPGSCLLVEEIDAGLHPTRIRLLVEYLETVTRERGIQVIATTHSPAVLQWLSDESLRNVVLCAVVPEREGTLLRRLGDLPHFDEVVKRKGIEELFSTGWLEMAV